MKRDLNVDQVLDSWFTEGPTSLPDRTVAAIAEGLDDVHQRGALGLPGRLSVPRFVPLASATVVALVAALALGVYLNGPGIGVHPSPSPSASTPGSLSPEPTTSPEGRGGLIAFAADSAAGDALTDALDHGTAEVRPNPMDIYVVREGQPTRRIIATDAHERCPSFSPDGTLLAYLEIPVGERPAPSLIVVRVDATGQLIGDVMRLLLPADEMYGAGLPRRLSDGSPCPKWSPDGTRLAYLAYPLSQGNGSSLDRADVRVATLDGQETILNPGRLANVGATFGWSANSDAIAFASENAIFRAPLDGSASTLMWRSDGTPTAVAWSAHGELAITVLTSIPTDGGGSQDVLSIHLVDPATGDHRQVGESSRAAWSPDGSVVALVEAGKVVLSNRDGSTTTLSPTRDGVEMFMWEVEWSTDGERLLARASSDLGYALVSMATTGTSVEVLTPWTYAMTWISLEDVSWQAIDAQ